MIRRRDDLKRVRAGCDGLIFDGMTFDDWTTEDAICLLDMDKPRSLPARFSDAFIEADVPMIFFTNKEPGKIFPGTNKQQRRALKRRYLAVDVTASP